MAPRSNYGLPRSSPRLGRAGSVGCGSIFGIFFGLLLLPVGLFLVYYGEVKLVNHGVVFARTPWLAAEATGSPPSPLVKFRGKPEGKFLRVSRYEGPVLYWNTDIEEYREERDSDGDLERTWKSIGGESRWADFSISGIKIAADRANAVGDQTVFRGMRKRYSEDFEARYADSSPAVGDQRLTLRVIPPDREIIVLGEVKQGTCSGGSSFVVSSLDAAGTEQALRTEYKILYWLIKAGAVLATWMGLLAIFGPLMGLVGWIPLLGERLSAGMAFAALAFSLAAVAVITLAVKLFWFVLAAVLLLVAVLVWRGISSPRQRPQPVSG